MGVVGNNKDGVRLGELREQIQGRQPDEEDIGNCIVGHAKGRPDCPSLRTRQLIDSADPRLQQLVKSCKRKIRLGLHPRRPQDAHTRCLGASDRLGQDRRLADADLTANQEGATAVTRSAEKFVDFAEFLLTSEQRLGSHLEAIFLSSQTVVQPRVASLADRPPSLSQSTLVAPCMRRSATEG